MIYPYFTYCIEVWGSTYSTYIDVIVKVQKQAIRTITSAKKYDHTSPLFEKLHLLKIKEIYVYYVQLFMFKFHHSLLPSIFRKFFVYNKDIHLYETKQKFHLHSFNEKSSGLGRIILREIGVNIYNFFRDQLKMNCKINTYRYHLKKFLIDNEVSLSDIFIYS